MPNSAAVADATRASDEGRARLHASRDPKDGRLTFPPLPPALPVAKGAEDLALGAEAVLYSFTIVHPNPKSGLPPFALAYADFPEGVRVFGRLDMQAGRPVIGQRLRAVVEPDADPAAPTYRFEPIP